MIAALYLALWTVTMLGIAWFSWIAIKRHLKVYLIIAYDAAYLAGAFFILSQCVKG